MNQDKMPLLRAVMAHLAMGYAAYHTPAHRGGLAVSPELPEIVGQAALAVDLTELPGLDDLHYPRGAIAAAQARVARLFGAAHTFFLVNGATAGVLAALMAATSPGDRVLVPRHAHRSVWSAMVLTGVVPHYLLPRWHPDWDIPLGIDPADIQLAVAEHPTARVLWLTNPTYQGLSSLAPATVELAHRHGLMVIVDEAHGSHFALHPDLPISGLEAGADMVIHSGHKTLGALTQTGLLHINRGVDKHRVAAALALVQSTSPSYIFMLSLEAVCGFWERDGGEKLGDLICLARETKGSLRQGGWQVLGDEVLAQPPVNGMDPARLVVGNGNGGAVLAEAFQRAGVLPEMAGSRHVLFLLAPGDRGDGAGVLVEKALALLPALEGKTWPPHPAGAGCCTPQVVLSPREAFFAPRRRVKLEGAAGRIAGEMIAPYPPGIPLVAPGERLTPDVMEEIKRCRLDGVHCQGPADPKLETVDVIDLPGL